MDSSPAAATEAESSSPSTAGAGTATGLYTRRSAAPIPTLAAHHHSEDSEDGTTDDSSQDNDDGDDDEDEDENKNEDEDEGGHEAANDGDKGSNGDAAPPSSRATASSLVQAFAADGATTVPAQADENGGGGGGSDGGSSSPPLPPTDEDPYAADEAAFAAAAAQAAGMAESEGTPAHASLDADLATNPNWKYRFCCGCCGLGAKFCVVKLCICAPCSAGKLWASLGLPGGCLLGGCVGTTCCGVHALRKRVAEDAEIADGIGMKVLACICPAFGFWQLYQQAPLLAAHDNGIGIGNGKVAAAEVAKEGGDEAVERPEAAGGELPLGKDAELKAGGAASDTNLDLDGSATIIVKQPTAGVGTAVASARIAENAKENAAAAAAEAVPAAAGNGAGPDSTIAKKKKKKRRRRKNRIGVVPSDLIEADKSGGDGE